MQSYSLKKLACALAAASMCAFCGFSESMERPSFPSKPAMPASPSMPEISFPNMDGGFYRPALPASPSSEKKTEGSSSDSSSKAEAVLSDGTSAEDLLATLLNSSNILSASDISNLYESGEFSTLSSLYSNSASAQSSTNVLLQQILKSLEELKTAQKNSTAAEKESRENFITDARTFKSREPSVLRFNVNGYNVADSLTTVFFSEPEQDGSFLLTADRKYFVNQKAYTETFYLLFSSLKNSGSSMSFSVTPSVAQGVKNTNSYIYRLAQQKNLVAKRTGNLVVLNSSGSDGFSVDLLLDIDVNGKR